MSLAWHFLLKILLLVLNLQYQLLFICLFVVWAFTSSYQHVLSTWQGRWCHDRSMEEERPDKFSTFTSFYQANGSTRGTILVLHWFQYIYMVYIVSLANSLTLSNYSHNNRYFMKFHSPCKHFIVNKILISQIMCSMNTSTWHTSNSTATAKQPYINNHTQPYINNHT